MIHVRPRESSPELGDLDPPASWVRMYGDEWRAFVIEYWKPQMRLENPYVLVNGSLVSDPLNLSIVKPLDKVQVRRGRIVEKTGGKNLKLTRAIRTWRYEMSKFRMVTAKCPIDKVPLVIAAIEHLGVNVIGSKK